MEEFNDEKQDDQYRIPDSTKFAATGTFVGMVAVAIMVTLSMVFPDEVSSMDSVRPVSQFIELAETYTTEITLLVVLDTIFIVGYSSLFVGLWLIIRDFSEIMSKVGLGLGLMVGFFDLVENTLLIVLVNGLQTGWVPDERLYGTVFILNTFIDLLSYVTALIYGIIYLLIFKINDRKVIIGILLVLYLLVGLGSIINPGLTIIRSLMFVLGLVVGGIILWTEEDIPTEILQKLLESQQERKNDFIR